MTFMRGVFLAAPLFVLVVSVAIAENYRGANDSRTESETQAPKLLGYNYNRQLVQLSVTLQNQGTKPLTISGVVYDNVTLAKGLVGVAIDHNLASDVGQSSKNIKPTNELIFAAADHWNMDTLGSDSPIVQPNGIATLYLGVTSTHRDSSHLLRIITSEAEYGFALEFKGD